MVVWGSRENKVQTFDFRALWLSEYIIYTRIVSYSILFDPSSNGMLLKVSFHRSDFLDIYYLLAQIVWVGQSFPRLRESSVRHFGFKTLWFNWVSCLEVSKSPRPGVVGPLPNGLNNGL